MGIIYAKSVLLCELCIQDIEELGSQYLWEAIYLLSAHTYIPELVN